MKSISTMIIIYYWKNLEHSAHGECKFYFKFKAFYLFFSLTDTYINLQYFILFKIYVFIYVYSHKTVLRFYIFLKNISFIL